MACIMELKHTWALASSRASYNIKYGYILVLTLHPCCNIVHIDSVNGVAWKYFTAVCWLFGQDMYEYLGYPICLVDTDWGGIPVEAWSSPDALAKCNIKQR